MTYQRKSAQEKLKQSKGLPKLVKRPKGKVKGPMLVPAPLGVDAQIKKAPKGKVTTPGRIRQALAKKARAKITCPLATGWFIRISAEAAVEERAEGRKRVTPWWRVVKEDGSINPSYPGKGKLQAKLLRKEGITVFKNKVKEFNKYLV